MPKHRGLSLFLTPKVLPDGRRNDLKAVRLEHKLAYAGSATCQMAFDGAQAWLIGERSKGLMASAISGARAVPRQMRASALEELHRQAGESA